MSEAVAAYRAQSAPRASRARLAVVAEPRAGYDPSPPGTGTRVDHATARSGGDAAVASRVDAGASGAVDAGAALAALAAAADLVARADLAALDPRELLEHTVAVDRQVTRVEAARARALAEIDRGQAYTEDACVTTASWLRWRTRRDFGHATRLAVTARRMAGLPLTRAAWEDGDITTAHAEAVAHAATSQRRDTIAEHEDTLVTLARRALPRDVRRVCARIADQVDPDGSDDGDGDPDGAAAGSGGGPDPRRRLHAAGTLDGLGDLRGVLDPVTHARLMGLLDALDRPDPPETAQAERRSFAQRRHDAFDRILRAAEEHPDLPTVHGARPHALMTIDLLALVGRDDLAVRPPRLASGAELDLARALDLLDQAALTPVLTLGPWRVVGVGRRHRTLPAWLRPLLEMVHGHCRGPGCDRPIAWTDAAHLTPWAAGSHTHLDDTIPACPGHHKLMDIAGWHVTLDPDTATCTWTSPDGHTTLRTHPPEP